MTKIETQVYNSVNGFVLARQRDGYFSRSLNEGSKQRNCGANDGSHKTCRVTKMMRSCLYDLIILGICDGGSHLKVVCINIAVFRAG